MTAHRADKTGSRIELLAPVEMGDKDFERLGKFIMSQYGIKMPPFKKVFLQSRLQKRLRTLGLNDFKEYVDLVFSPRGQQEELHHMIDAVSTNKTDFFREPVHFEFLLSRGLSDHTTKTVRNHLSAWSAGCSTGEEPYSLAMLLQEYCNRGHYKDYTIVATDISRGVLEHATIGIYQKEKTDLIPTAYQNNYLLKGTGQYENKVRIAPAIRRKIAFRQLNLLDKNYEGLGNFDILFCRNVLIYFERQVQYQILQQLCRHLYPGGYLFLGHSESIQGIDLPLIPVRPTIYMKKPNG